MANLEVGNVHGITDATGDFVDADAASIATMRARLQAIDANAYSDARLNSMTQNDMLYALRVHDDPDSIQDS